MTRRNNRVLWLLIVGVTARGVGIGWAAPQPGGPVAVSPGDASGVLIRDACPTFSWGSVVGAKSYDLLVYRLPEEGEEEQEQPVLHETFPGSASSWTPSLDRCFERGGRYAWSVRGVGGNEASEWSAPSLFEVASGPSEAEFEAALEVVWQYLGEETTGSVGVSAGTEGSLGVASPTPVAGPPEGASAGRIPLSVAMGDSALQVNGAAVVTTATLAGGVGAQLCLAVDYRYVDLGDGTVLDCNTDLLWLKNANCDGLKTWQAAKDWAETLASGSCGLTDGSQAGQWRLPEIGEVCSTQMGGVCPAANASDSLVNSNFTSPTVGNAAGDGQWAADDAFVGVQSSFYWSATEFGAPKAWFVSLNSGSVSIVSKASPNSVWPVRGGQ